MCSTIKTQSIQWHAPHNRTYTTHCVYFRKIACNLEISLWHNVYNGARTHTIKQWNIGMQHGIKKMQHNAIDGYLKFAASHLLHCRMHLRYTVHMDNEYLAHMLGTGNPSGDATWCMYALHMQMILFFFALNLSLLCMCVPVHSQCGRQNGRMERCIPRFSYAYNMRGNIRAMWMCTLSSKHYISMPFLIMHIHVVIISR